MGQRNSFEPVQLQCPACFGSQLAAWGERNGYRLYRCCGCSHRFADLGKRAKPELAPDEFRSYITNKLMDSDEEYYRHLCSGEREGAHTQITTRLVLNESHELWPNSDGAWLDVGF